MIEDIAGLLLRLLAALLVALACALIAWPLVYIVQNIRLLLR